MELVFQTDRKPMQGPDRLLVLCIISIKRPGVSERSIEEDFMETGEL